MRLGHQLAILSLTFLAIPWAGCEFLQANERSLLRLQQQALFSTGRAIADGLYGQKSLLYVAPERSTAPFDEQSLVVDALPGKPLLDGYFDDWPDGQPRRFGGQKRFLEALLGTHEQRLFIAIKVDDASKAYDQSGPATQATGDRLILVTWLENRRQEYVISTAAPGRITAQPLGRVLPQAQPDAIRGVWTDVGDGYQLELSMPLGLTGNRLGIYYLDSDEGGISVRGNVDPLAMRAPPFLVIGTAALSHWLEGYSGRGVGVQILDRWGWPLAAVAPDKAVGNGAEGGFTAWLYRQVLATPAVTDAPVRLATGQLTGPAIRLSQQGLESDRVFSAPDGLRSRFTTPIKSPNGVMGIVVIDSPRERYLSLNVPAFETLLFGGIGAMLLCYLALLGFAMLLGGRIRRLSHAVEKLDEKNEALIVDRFDDELSDLTRAFNQQLREQRQLRNYLRQLPQSLAHEIRTPIAIIRAALPLLGDSGRPPTEQQEIMARAEGGIERLTRLLNQMNEANQLEQMVGKEPREETELTVLLKQLTDAYTATFSDRQFIFESDVPSATAPVTPDLIVQAFDKLVANAVSFTYEGDTITLKIERRGLWWRLTVVNPGSQLPTDSQKLFQPMVSLRSQDDRQPGSLGLGLYIVSLVARHHGGEPWARDLPDGTGVEIGFTVGAQT